MKLGPESLASFPGVCRKLSHVPTLALLPSQHRSTLRQGLPWPRGELMALFMDQSLKVKKKNKTKPRKQSRASLVIQWLRFHQPMQETQVQFLVQEDPTCF